MSKRAYKHFFSVEFDAKCNGQWTEKRSTIYERYCFLVRWQKRWTNKSNDFQPISLSREKRLYLSIFSIILVNRHKKCLLFFKNVLMKEIFFSHQTSEWTDRLPLSQPTILNLNSWKREKDRHSFLWHTKMHILSTKNHLIMFPSYFTHICGTCLAHVSSFYRIESRLFVTDFLPFSIESIWNNVHIIENETVHANWIFNDFSRHWLYHNKSARFLYARLHVMCMARTEIHSKIPIQLFHLCH